MASYSSQYHEFPYYGGGGYGYDSAPTQSQSSLSYSSYDYNYASPSPYYYNDYGFSTLSYSVSASGVPRFLQHTPALSQFVVSYSTAEFNEPEFEEYDPTPYGGGYDLVATYGKPLPPSDRTCYPRSDGTTSQGSVPSPVPVPEEEVKVKESPAKEEIKVAPVPTIVGSTETISRPEEVESESEGGENGRGYCYPWAWDGYETQSGYACACCCHGNGGGRCCRGEVWSADYIFGCSGYPYGQGRELGGNYPNPIFGYERHSQEQSLEGQVQYQEPSLFNISTYFL